MVNGDKVWEEWQNVFNLEQVAAGQTVHGFLHVFLLLDHMPGDLQPKLFSQLLIILRQVCTGLGQIHIYLWIINIANELSNSVKDLQEFRINLDNYTS